MCLCKTVLFSCVKSKQGLLNLLRKQEVKSRTMTPVTLTWSVFLLQRQMCLHQVLPCCRDFFTCGYWDPRGSECSELSPPVKSPNNSSPAVSWKTQNYDLTTRDWEEQFALRSLWWAKISCSGLNVKRYLGQWEKILGLNIWVLNLISKSVLV